MAVAVGAGVGAGVDAEVAVAVGVAAGAGANADVGVAVGAGVGVGSEIGGASSPQAADISRSSTRPQKTGTSPGLTLAFTGSIHKWEACVCHPLYTNLRLIESESSLRPAPLSVYAKADNIILPFRNWQEAVDMVRAANPVWGTHFEAEYATPSYGLEGHPA